MVGLTAAAATRAAAFALAANGASAAATVESVRGITAPEYLTVGVRFTTAKRACELKGLDA